MFVIFVCCCSSAWGFKFGLGFWSRYCSWGKYLVLLYYYSFPSIRFISFGGVYSISWSLGMYSRSNKHRHAVSPSEITSLGTCTCTWGFEYRKLIGFLSEDLCLSFFSLLFHSFLRFADETCDFAKCLCLCLCPREREREIERGSIFGHVFALVPPD